MPVSHTLKTWRQPFQRTWDGCQDYEVRMGDRPFQVGDELILVEWHEGKNEEMCRRITATITGITGEYLDTSTPNRKPSGLLEGFVVLGIFIRTREKLVRVSYEDKWYEETVVPPWEAELTRKLKREAHIMGFIAGCVVIGIAHLAARWFMLR
jgi:hypothetical protein